MLQGVSNLDFAFFLCGRTQWKYDRFGMNFIELSSCVGDVIRDATAVVPRFLRVAFLPQSQLQEVWSV